MRSPIHLGVPLVLLSLWTARTGNCLPGGDAQAQAVFEDHEATQSFEAQLPSQQELPEHVSLADDLPFDVLGELRRGLDVMQRTYFALWVGTWPRAIDWTAAVVDTHLVASLGTFSRVLKQLDDSDEHREASLRLSNELNRYFGQNIAYYFGEDAFSIRFQAYDDMLWVVLGWLESIKSIKLQSALHHRPVTANSEQPWHGTQFIDAYAHRARVFYELAAPGWDTTLCGGGMTWNPRLGPYKNAITNQLWISASIGMYLYFPGDRNDSPFITGMPSSNHSRPPQPQDPKYLQAAIDGYNWLQNSGMQNRKGLYIDGFHITDWKTNGTACDIRNTEVYTYNQGVVLSGLRGLWESTGNLTYLTDGHKLIRNVILATGWLLDDANNNKPPKSTEWSGLGRAGIMEERCDSAGNCDQTPQSFKGIFFHHLTLFCEPLPTSTPLVPGKTFVADKATRLLHRQSCKSYVPWLAHNAGAALGTRNSEGRFGTWWGVNTGNSSVEPTEKGAVEYRNDPSELEGELWRPRESASRLEFIDSHRILFGREEWLALEDDGLESSRPKDPNDRGKGRTVESQGGGVAVLRALWEFVNLE